MLTPEREAEIRRSVNADYDYGDAERISGEGQELLAEIDRLRASVVALRQDKERLDWLGYVGHGFVRGTDVSRWTVEAPEEGIRTIRQAIDAAWPRGTANETHPAHDTAPEATEKDKENISKGKRL